jgi:uncharacterized protein YndB with AHSA1/START domain
MTAGSDATETLRFVRVLAHPPERVWEALTSPEDLRQWMPAQQVRIEPHVGGDFEVRGLFHGKGRILVWQPPHRFEHEFHLVTSGGTKDAGVVGYDLQPEGGGTRLTMTFRSLTPPLARLFERGHGATFDRLEAVLDGRPVPTGWTR